MAIRRHIPVLTMLLLLFMVSAGPPATEPGAGSILPVGQQVYPDGLHAFSGDSQGGLPDSRLPEPLTVLLMGAGAPMSGETVRFELTDNGSGSLEGGGPAGPAVDVETGADGKASVNLSTGVADGPIHVNASWNNESVSFTCHSVALQPVLSIRGVNETGVNILFDARASGGDDLQYIFDFGDGSTSGIQTSPTVIHQYSEPGRYTVGLTVVGPHGVNHTTYEEIGIREDADGGTMGPMTVWAFLVVALLLLFATLYLFSRSLLKDAMSRIRAQDLRAKDDKYDMAVSLALAGEGDRALTYFKAVLEEDPAHSKAHFYKGVVLMDKNRLKAARRSFAESLVHDPGNGPARKALEAVDIVLGAGRQKKTR